MTHAKQAQKSTSVHHLYLDLGNSAIKFSFGSGVNQIRSIYVSLDAPIGGNTASPCISFGKSHYLVGANAAHTGKPVQEFAAADSKLKNLFIGMFSCLPPAYSGYRWNLTLTLLLPFGTSKSVQESFRKQLMSKVWDYRYNGIDASVEVTEVYFVSEGVGSYNYAIYKQQISKDDLVLVLDIGGNTAIARQMIGGSELWSAVFSNTGAIQLASRIATAIQSKLGTVPNVYEVLDAIGGGTLKVRGMSIEADFKRERKTWFTGILQQISYQMKNVGLSPSTKILLCGGGALISADEVKGNDKYVVCADANLSNLLGIAPDMTGAAHGNRVNSSDRPSFGNIGQ